MANRIEWVRETASLRVWLERLGRGPLSLDSEADSMHHYPERVCLVQLSFGGADLLIDPLAGVDMGPLAAVLADAGVRKIIHGADYDLRILHRDFGLVVNGLFDTMVAARLTGESEFGLAALLKKHFGVEADKRYQRADWSRRPLPAEMEAYAALDTRYLAKLKELLERRLSDLGRIAWAEEEFRRLEAVRWIERADSEAFRRVKGSAALSPRQLAVLRELVRFREQQARQRNRPPFRIASNEQLLRLVQADPRSAAALTRMPGLPRSWTRSKDAQQVAAAMQRARDLPESGLPEVRRRAKRPGNAFERRLRRLLAQRDRLAQELDLEPAVVASRGVLEATMRGLEGGEGLPEELRRWQADLLRPALEDVSG
jgi:ribonuclease D